MRYTKILGLVLCLLTTIFSKVFADNEAAKESALLKKNFHLCYLIENGGRQQVSDTMKKIAQMRIGKLKDAIKNCKNSSCLAEALQLNEAEIEQIGVELSGLAKKNSGLLRELRNSRTYANFNVESDSVFLVKSWQLSAKAMNRILAVYVNGTKPTYPKIDAGDFAANDPVYFKQLKQMIEGLVAKDKACLSLPGPLACQY